MNKELKEIIKKSGSNLHTETAQLLKDSGWDVDLSSYYHDDITDKPREIDIIANKNKSVVSFHGKGRTEFKVYLFIECKYFKNEVAFWVSDNRTEDSKSAIIFHGMNEDILSENNTPLAKIHHYVQVPYMAKLYDSKENSDIFNAITGSVKSLVFFKEHRKEKGLYYPLIVYDGIAGFYTIDKNDLSVLDELKPVKDLVFSFKYSYRSAIQRDRLSNQYFCVDFIHKNNLIDFLEKIEEKEVKEVEKFADFLLIKGRTL